MKNVLRNAVALLFILTVTLSSSHGQDYLNQVIIANGGQFEFSGPPWADRATVGSYNPYLGTYTIFDTIQAESVQQVLIDGDFAFVAAQDTIVKYNTLTHQRVGTLPFASIRSLSIAGDRLIVGKWFGTGPFLSVYDKNTLALEFSVPQITETVYGAAVIGDTLYALYNTKGTIDNCPPFGCFDDSLGKIGQVHIPSQLFIDTIELDTLGNEAKHLYSDSNRLFVISDANGVISDYEPATGTLNMQQIGITGGFGLFDGKIYAGVGNAIGSYDISGDSIFNSAIVNRNRADFVAADFDPLNEHFYFTETDFASFGKTLIYDITGALVDSFDVEISPEGMAVEVRSDNAAPYAFVDSISTFNVNPIVVDVQANDIDPNGDSLVTTIFSNTSWGNASVLDGDSISFLTFAGYNGMDSLRYTVCDNQTPPLCDTAKVYFDVSTTVGLDEATEAPKFMIYPNPASDFIHVAAGQKLDGTISFVSMTGQVIQSNQASSSSAGRWTLPLANLSPGNYLLRIESNGSVEHLPFVKR